MNIPKSYEALAADLASEKILSKTLQAQKEAYMMLADGRKVELDAALAREAALREELEAESKGADRAAESLMEWRRDCVALQQRLTVAEQRAGELATKLGDAYEWGYDDGQNSPNGYSDKEDRDECVAAMLKPAEEVSREVAKESLGFENQRIQPARFHCLACGDYHEGSGNLTCPKMKPMSGVKP